MTGGTPKIVAALLLGGGIALGGWFAGEGFRAGRAADRFVTVKGISEREAKADLALWPIRFVATSDALVEAQAKVTADAGIVRAFLTEAGIANDEITVQSVQVTDRLAMAWQSGPIQSRFIVARTLMVRTGDVDRIAALSQRTGALLEAGVVLSDEGQPFAGPTYIFSGLSDLKPAMIAEATQRARAGAEQFAADSGSTVGGIRRASQGVFQILPRDNAPGQQEPRQVMKTVRIVSTIDFALVD